MSNAEIRAGAFDRDPLLGVQLRQVRKTRGLSLQQLAEPAGLSIALISKVERGITAPSLRSLRRLCEGLEIPVSWLFHDRDHPAPADRGVVVRPSTRRTLALPQSGYTKQLLTPDLTGTLQMLLVSIVPGGSSGEDRYSHEGEECGLVLAGRLDLWAGSATYLLGAGDSFRFASTLPHRFANPGPEVTEVIWISTPPFY